MLIFGLYAAVSLQKAVRDKDEGIPVTNIYFGISWLALIISVFLMGIGLYNAGSIILSEKGFYGMAFVLSLFAAVTVQKNIRDSQGARERDRNNLLYMSYHKASGHVCWTVYDHKTHS